MKDKKTSRTGTALRLLAYMTLIAALLLPATVTPAQAAPIRQDAPTEPVSAAAVGATFNVTSTNCTLDFGQKRMQG